MYATNYFENLMLNLMRSQSITAPSALYLALFRSNPGDDGTSGTEVSYSGYQRMPVTFSAPTASGSGLMISNSELITFPESSVTEGAVQYVAVYDSQTGGNMWLYGQLDNPLNIQPGVSPVFRAGSVSWIWSGNLSDYYRRAIMNTLRGTACSGFSPYIALCNGDAEFSGNNYERFAVTMSAPAQQSSGTAMSQNTADVISPISTGAWGTLTTVAIYDARTNGHAFATGTLGTSYTINNGYSVTIPSGNLQVNVN